jgi:DNA-binding CsgD family transcriptional regulator
MAMHPLPLHDHRAVAREGRSVLRVGLDKAAGGAFEARTVEDGVALILGWIKHAPAALCVLDSNARVLAMSAAAKKFFSVPNGFYLGPHGITAHAPAVDKTFRAALAGKRGRVVVAHAPDGKAATLAYVAPGANKTAMVRFRHPGFEALTAYAALPAYFGLSRQQARIAADVVLGRSLDDIALRRGIKLATVRSHLKVIFGKLAISHRGDIATVLLRHMF